MSGDQVYVRNYLRGDKWLPGVIIEKIASQMFKVQMNGEKIRRCHLDQLRNLTEPPADITRSTTPVQPEPPSELPIRDHPELPIRDPPEPDPPEHSDRGNDQSPATNIPESG